MNSLLRRLAAASVAGAALAALATGCTTASPAEDDGGDGGSGGGGETLDPYPESALGCFGEDHMGPAPGYWGQCCTDVACITPPNGVCEFDWDYLQMLLLPGPDNPGECSCSPDSTGTLIDGPYAPTESDTGSCCYIIGTIACDGRPLLVEGAARVARVRQRLDWLS